MGPVYQVLPSWWARHIHFNGQFICPFGAICVQHNEQVWLWGGVISRRINRMLADTGSRD
jgi:hypothetical protein